MSRLEWAERLVVVSKKGIVGYCYFTDTELALCSTWRSRSNYLTPFVPTPLAWAPRAGRVKDRAGFQARATAGGWGSRFCRSRRGRLRSRRGRQNRGDRPSLTRPSTEAFCAGVDGANLLEARGSARDDFRWARGSALKDSKLARGSARENSKPARGTGRTGKRRRSRRVEAPAPLVFQNGI